MKKKKDKALSVVKSGIKTQVMYEEGVFSWDPVLNTSVAWVFRYMPHAELEGWGLQKW